MIATTTTTSQPLFVQWGADVFPENECKLRLYKLSSDQSKAYFYETPFATTQWEEYYSFEPQYYCWGTGVSLPLELGKAYSSETIHNACENVYA